ncbi:MAG TPA: hypothetical protein PLI77_03825 [Bacteroidales bacterium]|nr:hypothetical protein [Bacteroidales bacterium]
MINRRHKEPVWLMIIRVALALLFLFSGFTKAVDPVAWGIKMEEYFTSFGMDFMHPLSFYIGFIPTIAELLLGFMLLLRIRVNITTIGYLLFMTFFFLLTLWLAIAEHLEVKYGLQLGVVKDCGCFGQAVEMSNMETFLKNVLIMIPTLIIFFKRKSIPDIKLTILGQWILVAVGALIALGFEIYCVVNLPPIDYTNWKVGNNVSEYFIDKPAQKEIVFLYKNKQDSTQIVALTENQMMTITDQKPLFYDEYDYLDRKDSLVSPLIPAKKSGFNMLDSTGRDFASAFINSEKSAFILFIHNLDEANLKGINHKNLQALILDCKEKNIDFVAVTNSSEQEIKLFIEKNKITYPIFHNPIDPVKGPFMVRDAVRSNPGLLWIEKGIVVKKWSWRNFPDQISN